MEPANEAVSALAAAAAGVDDMTISSHDYDY